jgi:activator of 2-hydroxyglutaryl-CoA dehydratase
LYLFEVTLKTKKKSRLARRCSVSAKTNKINLQQEATPSYDIVARICFAMARNLKSNIARGNTVVPPARLTGGVATKQGVHRALIEIMGILPRSSSCRPTSPAWALLGAVLIVRDCELVRPLSGLDTLRIRVPPILPARPNACPDSRGELTTVTT